MKNSRSTWNTPHIASFRHF